MIWATAIIIGTESRTDSMKEGTQMISGGMLFRRDRNQSTPFTARFFPRPGEPQALSVMAFENETALRSYLTDIMDSSMPLERRQYQANQTVLELKGKDSVTWDSVTLTDKQFEPYK
jgi:hypothetical protein